MPTPGEHKTVQSRILQIRPGNRLDLRPPRRSRAAAAASTRTCRRRTGPRAPPSSSTTSSTPKSASSTPATPTPKAPPRQVPPSPHRHLRQPRIRRPPAQPGQIPRPGGKPRARPDPHRLRQPRQQRLRSHRGVRLSQRPLRHPRGCRLPHQRHPGAGDRVQERQQGRGDRPRRRPDPPLPRGDAGAVRAAEALHRHRGDRLLLRRDLEHGAAQHLQLEG